MNRLLPYIAITVSMVVISINCSPSYAQEIRFSQYQATPLYVNPAFASALPNPSLRFHSRLQNVGVVNFRTGYASLNLPIFLTQSESPTGGVGINFLQDVAGENSEYRTTLAQLAATYNIYLDRYATQWISLGLQTGFRQTRIDFSQLQWPSQLRYNGFTGTSIPYENYPDQLNILGINAGLMWFYDPVRNPLSEVNPLRLHAGFSVSNLNKPAFGLAASSDNSLDMDYSVQAGAEFPVGKRMTISPSLMAYWQYPFFTYQLGSSLTYHTQYSTPSNPIPSEFRLMVGSWYRAESTLVFLLGLGGKKWQTAFSYDINISSEQRDIPNQYAVELSFIYQWFPKNAPKNQSTPLF